MSHGDASKTCVLPASHYVSFDDECTMSEKGKYFSGNEPGKDYGGVIVWAYNHDEFREGRYGIVRCTPACPARRITKLSARKTRAEQLRGAFPKTCDHCFMSARRPVKVSAIQPCVAEECPSGSSEYSSTRTVTAGACLWAPAASCATPKSPSAWSAAPNCRQWTPASRSVRVRRRQVQAEPQGGTGTGIDYPNYDNSSPCNKCRGKNGCW